MSQPLSILWNWLAQLDPTLRLKEQELYSLREKRLRVVPYEPRRAFEKLSTGKIGLFRNLSIPIRHAGVGNPELRDVLLKGLRTGFPNKAIARIQIGPTRRRAYITVKDLVQRWERERSVISVTDLHFRATRFNQFVDTSELDRFNILCTDKEYAEEFIDKIEMMTLVISAAKNVTDSHTDDCDGTNHCFLGRKLWLAWDSQEGKKKGLQDTSHDEVNERAAFDMTSFLALPSAKWFVINPGETLFLPGSFAHKVITLQPYIGVGSFNVTLPGALLTLSRWHLNGTTDIHRKKLFAKISESIIRRINSLRKAPKERQEEWGLSYLEKGFARWNLNENTRNKKRLLGERGFAELVEAALNLPTELGDHRG